MVAQGVEEGVGGGPGAVQRGQRWELESGWAFTLLERFSGAGTAAGTESITLDHRLLFAP